MLCDSSLTTVLSQVAQRSSPSFWTSAPFGALLTIAFSILLYLFQTRGRSWWLHLRLRCIANPQAGSEGSLQIWNKSNVVTLKNARAYLLLDNIKDFIENPPIVVALENGNPVGRQPKAFKNSV